MTLSDNLESSPMANSVDFKPAGMALRSVLLVAKREGRLTCGVYLCGKTLEMYLDDVLLCVLPETADDDVTLRMHSILIEAFCLENNIQVVKVDCANKLCHLLSDSGVESKATELDPQSDEDEGSGDTSATDYHCLLVMYPKDDELTKDEEAVLNFLNITYDIFPQPVIDLPV